MHLKQYSVEPKCFAEAYIDIDPFNGFAIAMAEAETEWYRLQTAIVIAEYTAIVNKDGNMSVIQEGAWETIKGWWASFVAFMKRIWDNIANFFKELFSSNDTLSTDVKNELMKNQKADPSGMTPAITSPSTQKEIADIPAKTEKIKETIKEIEEDISKKYASFEDAVVAESDVIETTINALRNGPSLNMAITIEPYMKLTNTEDKVSYAKALADVSSLEKASNAAEGVISVITAAKDRIIKHADNFIKRTPENTKQLKEDMANVFKIFDIYTSPIKKGVAVINEILQHAKTNTKKNSK